MACDMTCDLVLQEVDKMKRGFEEQMTKMRGEVSKIQEEKVCVCVCVCVVCGLRVWLNSDASLCTSRVRT